MSDSPSQSLSVVLSLLDTHKGNLNGVNEQELRAQLTNPKFKALIEIQSLVSEFNKQPPKPTTNNALTLVKDFLTETLAGKSSPQINEVRSLLGSPHFLGAVLAHDKIANRDFTADTSKPKVIIQIPTVTAVAAAAPAAAPASPAPVVAPIVAPIVVPPPQQPPQQPQQPPQQPAEQVAPKSVVSPPAASQSAALAAAAAAVVATKTAEKEKPPAAPVAAATPPPAVVETKPQPPPQQQQQQQQQQPFKFSTVPLPIPVRTADIPIKTVHVEKHAGQSFGATVAEVNGRVFIARIMLGGAAAASGLLTPGDEILAVNDQDISKKSIEQVVGLIKTAVGVVSFRLRSAAPDSGAKPPPLEPKFLVRAMFDYVPEKDELTPCVDAMLAFSRRDILDVINTDDENWWQVRKHGTSKVGLVPSQGLQEVRRSKIISYRHSIKSNDSATTNGHGRASNAASDVSKKDSLGNTRNQSLYLATSSNKDKEVEESVNFGLYDIVEERKPSESHPRPFVIVGTDGVGKSEIRRKLLNEYSKILATVVPHTSRAPRDGEQNGREYYFIDKETMARDIADDKFIEHGEYKENLYGTHLDSVQKLTYEGKTVLLEVHPQALRQLKRLDPIPYVVFVKPASLDILKKKHPDIAEKKLQEVIQSSAKIDKNFGQYFDLCVVNEDFATAFETLKSSLEKSRTEPYWAVVSKQ